jgi:hypothetical protein
MKVVFKTLLSLALTCFLFSLSYARTDETELFKEHKDNIRKGNTCQSCHDVGEIKDLTHISAWITSHKSVATRKEGECLKCHSQDFCADCHSLGQGLKPSEKNFDDTQPSYPHRGEWKTRHTLEAKSDPSKCYRCHTKNFCSDCHPKIESSHPSGWLSVHGEEARKNPGACASCHEDGGNTVCISCHKVGGPGGNPHPGGWSDEHVGIKRDKDRPCVYCHGK